MRRPIFSCKTNISKYYFASTLTKNGQNSIIDKDLASLFVFQIVTVFRHRCIPSDGRSCQIFPLQKGDTYFENPSIFSVEIIPNPTESDL